LVTLLSQINKLLLCGTDIENAYLQATTKKIVYIIGGPKFGALEGHTLVVYKALYGIRLSGYAGINGLRMFSAIIYLYSMQGRRR
jgi:energy-converting hydrogenase Eha subunit B